jgi:hypothetical protein
LTFLKNVYKGTIKETKDNRVLEEPHFSKWSEKAFTIMDNKKRYPKVFEQGKQDCKESEKSGIKRENPYPKDSDQFYAWNTGWNLQMGILIQKD